MVKLELSETEFEYLLGVLNDCTPEYHYFMSSVDVAILRDKLQEIFSDQPQQDNRTSESLSETRENVSNQGRIESGLGLTNAEILKVVNRYIGVSGGYLGDFSYRTHAEFYPEYCNLDIDPDQYPGTTRERFIAILKSSPPTVQAKILRGVIERFPTSANAPTTRIQSLQDEVLEIITRLEGILPIVNPKPQITSAVVERAIKDTETFLQSGGAVSGVDRIHTALHGYLKAVCDDAGIQYSKEDSIARLLKLFRQKHPALQNLGVRAQDIERVLQAFSSIMDALNPIRNNASVAHANETLLEKEEAMLVINAARTIIHYLDAKFSK